ncbi:hypothetical protein N0V93_007164 [Gnomoniopsis smithogilvyi]|uniref:Ysc84 actin-binding domain-containing protein n=1 Tax=Gnomoniopsis smithogilvyi TaxID=1191159 RepID=A0A9W9CWE6_9PEZI|nr:hypothetical protein N0V93_007164 [Gnomoniopsis smithogilvyi]
MQRISSFWTSSRDNKPRRGSASTTASKAADPPARRVREDYWPTTLDRETEKASRILHSFCTEGYIAHQEDPIGSPRSSVSSVQIKKKIPPRIVQNAVGLAVFSCMRSGLWKSGSGGSGILVARKSDGTWSAPSGLLLHTAALGFVIGVDVYDCVLVINSLSDLETFTREKTTLGADVELAVGPVMSAGAIENRVQGKDLDNAVLTYVKARGEHRAVNIDGSLVTERVAENHRFYGRAASVLDILGGKVPHLDSPEIKTMYEVIKSAEGRVDFDARMLEHLALQPAPGDAVIEASSLLSPLSPGTPAFGVPDNEDVDPFGVKALEMAGLEIREAGTNLRPSSSQFEYNPNPTSPLFSHFSHRQSVDTYRTQSNSNRASAMSSRSNRTTFSRMTDAFTQTSIDTRVTTPSSEDGHDWTSVDRLPVVMEPVEVDYTQVDDSAIKRWSQEHQEEESKTADEVVGEATDANVEPILMAATVAKDQDNSRDSNKEMPTLDERDEDADDEDDSEDEAGTDTLDEAADENSEEEEDDEDDFDEDEDEPVIFEVYEAKAVQAVQPARTAIMSSQATQVTQAKGALVTIPKRVAPPVPLRSPARSSRSEFGEIPAKSPLRASFQSGRSRNSSVEGSDVRSMDGVINTLKTEVPTNVTTARPVDQETETPDSERRQSGDSHRSHAIFTTVMEHRLSLEDMPKTPSTLQTSGHTSSGDEREPRTPKPEENVVSPEDERLSQKFTHREVRDLVVESS